MEGFSTTIESFQRKTCVKFYNNVHHNCQKSNSKLLVKSHKIFGAHVSRLNGVKITEKLSRDLLIRSESR